MTCLLVHLLLKVVCDKYKPRFSIGVGRIDREYDGLMCGAIWIRDHAS